MAGLAGGNLTGRQTPLAQVARSMGTCVGKVRRSEIPAEPAIFAHRYK